MVALAAGMAGCGTPAFHCLDASDCVDGTCEPNGFCSFPDTDCPSGSRYGEHAGAGLANTCVEPQAADTDPVVGDDDGTTGVPPTTGEGDTTGPALDPDTTTSTTADPTTGSPLDGTDEGTTSTGPTSASSGGSSDDSPPQVQFMSFGERAGADVQGVTEDTFISFWELGNNNGSHADQHVASIDGDTPVEVALSRFDVSALEDVTVVSVELILSSYAVTSDGTINLYRVLESWDEGVQDQSAGICNWQLREEDSPWLGAGAQGDSHDPDVVGSFSLDEAFTDFSIDVAPELVQGWIDDPGSNHGVLFSSTEVPDAIWWASSEEPDESLRPLLVVRYLE